MRNGLAGALSHGRAPAPSARPTSDGVSSTSTPAASSTLRFDAQVPLSFGDGLKLKVRSRSA